MFIGVKLAGFFGIKGIWFRQFKGLFTTGNGVIFIGNQSTTGAMKNIAILVPETAVIVKV